MYSFSLHMHIYTEACLCPNCTFALCQNFWAFFHKENDAFKRRPVLHLWKNEAGSPLVSTWPADQLHWSWGGYPLVILMAPVTINLILLSQVWRWRLTETRLLWSKASVFDVSLCLFSMSKSLFSVIPYRCLSFLSLVLLGCVLL